MLNVTRVFLLTTISVVSYISDRQYYNPIVSLSDTTYNPSKHVKNLFVDSKTLIQFRKKIQLELQRTASFELQLK